MEKSSSVQKEMAILYVIASLIILLWVLCYGVFYCKTTSSCEKLEIHTKGVITKICGETDPLLYVKVKNYNLHAFSVEEYPKDKRYSTGDSVNVVLEVEKSINKYFKGYPKKYSRTDTTYEVTTQYIVK